MQIDAHRVYKFDSFLPIYNWIYPLSGHRSDLGRNKPRLISPDNLSSRAIYVHIPFCETICSFCPFVRGQYRSADLIEAYTSALIAEIHYKSDLLKQTRNVPVKSIFFGGGTPSLLTPGQAERIILALRSHFDLTSVQEFSFEFEVKSVTDELAAALAANGVTHARFGLQTFNPEYRNLFSLTSTLEQIERARTILTTHFPHASCDILYGMNGQNEEQFIADIDKVTALNLTNIDFYPINNVVTQKKLHAAFRRKRMAPLSGMTKFYMNAALRQVMRERGYLPHNGHGYVRCDAEEIRTNPIVTAKYSFVYHEHIYGYQDRDVIGFGVNAISSTNNFVFCNEQSRERYIRDLLQKNQCNFTAFEHGDHIDAARPICLHLPYHGDVDLSRTNWDAVPSDTKIRLESLIESGLVCSDGQMLTLSLEGWHWYTNIMYWLLPHLEQAAVDEMIRQALASRGRDIEETAVPVAV